MSWRTGVKSVNKKRKSSTFGKKSKDTSKRVKIATIQSLRNKADKFCTPVALKLNPNCLLCGGRADTGHHFIKKSESNRLRYDTDNLVSLCTFCHCRLHAHETIESGKIIKIKGLDWLQILLSRKLELVRVNRDFYEEAIGRLSEMLSKI